MQPLATAFSWFSPSSLVATETRAKRFTNVVIFGKKIITKKMFCEEIE